MRLEKLGMGHPEKKNLRLNPVDVCRGIENCHFCGFFGIFFWRGNFLFDRYNPVFLRDKSPKLRFVGAELLFWNDFSSVADTYINCCSTIKQMSIMRKMIMTIGIVVAFIAVITMEAHAQYTETGLPGDNFSLDGAMDLFREASSPEDFEKMINDPNNNVNNLDLNGDGQVDYVRVEEQRKGDTHLFFLRAVVSAQELQDIAMIEVNLSSDGEAVAQIVGDEDMYGEEVILEPTKSVSAYAGTSTVQVNINVWAWPMVQTIYRPSYSVWVSPWGLLKFPTWWSRWAPVPYHKFYANRPQRQQQKVHYRAVNQHRAAAAPRVYGKTRSTSPTVYKRYNSQVSKYRQQHNYTPTYKNSGFHNMDKQQGSSHSSGGSKSSSKGQSSSGSHNSGSSHSSHGSSGKH